MLPIPKAMLSVLLIGSIATGAYIVANQQSPKNNDETTAIENNVEDSKESKLNVEEEKKSEPAADAKDPTSEDDGIEISVDSRSGNTSLSIELITQSGNIGTRLESGSTTQEPSETIPEVTNTVISAKDQGMNEIEQQNGSKNTKQIENAEADSDKEGKIETKESTSTWSNIKNKISSVWSRLWNRR